VPTSGGTADKPADVDLPARALQVFRRALASGANPLSTAGPIVCLTLNRQGLSRRAWGARGLVDWRERLRSRVRMRLASS
jgi:hypothetical protein